MPVTQDNRMLSITTPLGKDVLLIEGFTMTEGVSTPFVIHADVLSEITKASMVTANALIGKDAVIQIVLPQGKERFFHGMIRALVHSGRGLEERFARFSLEIVPRLSRLRERTDCRIFQNLPASDVIKQVLKDRNIEFRDALAKTYTKRDYCVQYRESDLDFIQRLMEDEGIFYWFEHKKDSHKMVLADKPDAISPCPQQAKAQYKDEKGVGDPIDAVGQLTVTEQLCSGLTTFRDHHFQLPDKKLESAEVTSIHVGQNSELELYDYPAGYTQYFNEPDARLGDVEKEGQKIIRMRMEEEEVPYKVAQGASDVRAFVTGYRFALEGHFIGDYNTDWLLTSVRHNAVQSPDYVSGEDVPDSYSNSFTCIPHKVPYLPPRRTRKPIISGPQTAVVTGPAGEEIFPDKYGRVKVQFHWDRLGKKDEKSSCWIRVATPWAGKNWGMIHIPRIAQEVIVQFEEGDPDRPLIVGSVYNADQMPPYELPNHKTQSGVKSRSSMGGGASNFNEIRFEDKKGAEQVYVHAERNLDSVVEADETRAVGGDRTTRIHKNDILSVEKEDLYIGVLEGDMKVELTQGNHSTLVALGNKECGVPAGTDKLVANEVLIDATTHLKITCGASTIEMTPGNIKITSPMVLIN